MKKYRIISCDFDGTLCDSNYPECGEPIQEVIDELLYEKENGALIILNTMREGKPLTDALNWCKEQGIEFDAVNDNVDVMKDFFKNNPRKIFATEYWDDRNGDLTEIRCRGIIRKIDNDIAKRGEAK